MSFSIIGTGSGFPERVVTNDDLAQLLDTSDEWIRPRTGIRERRVATKETVLDLALAVARNALDSSGIGPEELDCILCATLRGDYFTPSLACLLQGALGADCPAFDINGACSGFLYALDVADCYFARGKAQKIMVVAAEMMSKLVDWKDRSTCVLFGDGAGAVVLGPGNDLLSIKVTAKGGAELLRAPNVHGNSPFDETEELPCVVYMNGQEVYKFAVSSMQRGVQAVVQQAGLTLEDVNYILPHQANIRIIDAAAHKLKMPRERILTNIDRHGNTSGAGIPALLDECARAGTFHRGDMLVMSSFGSGLTTGACVLRWSGAGKEQKE